MIPSVGNGCFFSTLYVHNSQKRCSGLIVSSIFIACFNGRWYMWNRNALQKVSSYWYGRICCNKSIMFFSRRAIKQFWRDMTPPKDSTSSRTYLQNFPEHSFSNQSSFCSLQVTQATAFDHSLGVSLNDAVSRHEPTWHFLVFQPKLSVDTNQLDKKFGFWTKIVSRHEPTWQFFCFFQPKLSVDSRTNLTKPKLSQLERIQARITVSTVLKYKH